MLNLRSQLNNLDLPPILPEEPAPERGKEPLCYYDPETAKPLRGDTVERLLRWQVLVAQGSRNMLRASLSYQSAAVTVHTAHLGFEHGTRQTPAPLLWETVIASALPQLNDWVHRYCTKNAALAGHDAIVECLVSAGATLIEETGPSDAFKQQAKAAWRKLTSRGNG